MRLLNAGFDLGAVLTDWRGVGLAPLHKGNGDKYEWCNLIGMSLLSVAGKLYGIIRIILIQS